MGSSLLKAAMPGVSAQTLAVAFDEIATMLHAGLPLDQALSSCQASPATLRIALTGVARQVAAGYSLSESLKQYKTLYHPLVYAMVTIGESTGNLDHTFSHLAEYYRAEAQLKRTIQNALIYPVFTAVVAAIAVLVLIYLGFLPATWARLLLWVGLIIAIIWLLLRFRTAQRIARYVVMGLPFFGGIMLLQAVTRFCHTFGLLIRAGMPYLEGLELTKGVVQHPLVESATDAIYAGVRNGISIEQCMRSQTAFPPVVYNLVGVGETSGALDDTLLKAAEYIRRDTEYRIKNAAKLVGPALVIILGVIVALILAFFWSGYFERVLSILEE